MGSGVGVVGNDHNQPGNGRNLSKMVGNVDRSR